MNLCPCFPGFIRCCCVSWFAYFALFTAGQVLNLFKSVPALCFYCWCFINENYHCCQKCFLLLAVLTLHPVSAAAVGRGLSQSGCSALTVGDNRI